MMIKIFILFLLLQVCLGEEIEFCNKPAGGSANKPTIPVCKTLQANECVLFSNGIPKLYANITTSETAFEFKLFAAEDCQEYINTVMVPCTKLALSQPYEYSFAKCPHGYVNTASTSQNSPLISFTLYLICCIYLLKILF